MNPPPQRGVYVARVSTNGQSLAAAHSRMHAHVGMMDALRAQEYGAPRPPASDSSSTKPLPPNPRQRLDAAHSRMHAHVGIMDALRAKEYGAPPPPASDNTQPLPPNPRQRLDAAPSRMNAPPERGVYVPRVSTNGQGFAAAHRRMHAHVGIMDALMAQR
jgi:hypothetical protein